MTFWDTLYSENKQNNKTQSIAKTSNYISKYNHYEYNTFILYTRMFYYLNLKNKSREACSKL